MWRKSPHPHNQSVETCMENTRNPVLAKAKIAAFVLESSSPIPPFTTSCLLRPMDARNGLTVCSSATTLQDDLDTNDPSARTGVNRFHGRHLSLLLSLADTCLFSLTFTSDGERRLPGTSIQRFERSSADEDANIACGVTVEHEPCNRRHAAVHSDGKI
jgi:hypothetical protein